MQASGGRGLHGVSMYSRRTRLRPRLRQITVLAPGSTLAMTFILPLELAEPEERPVREAAEQGARATGMAVMPPRPAVSRLIVRSGEYHGARWSATFASN
jgi:hypothetical protein